MEKTNSSCLQLSMLKFELRMESPLLFSGMNRQADTQPGQTCNRLALHARQELSSHVK